MVRHVLILGHGAHARAVAMLLEQNGYTTTMTRKDEDAAALRRPDVECVLIGVGCSDMLRRRALYYESLPMPRARLWSAWAGEGSVIFPGCTISANARIGANTVLYSGCIVEHDSVIGDHAWLSPGVILCGRVTIRPLVFLGAGAVVLPGVTIGAGARIGAGAVIHENIEDGVTVLGPRSTPCPS